MSTPVSGTTPPRRRHPSSAAPTTTSAVEDLQAHMQRMIDLQYQQQSFYTNNKDATDETMTSLFPIASPLNATVSGAANAVSGAARPLEDPTTTTQPILPQGGQNSSSSQQPPQQTEPNKEIMPQSSNVSSMIRDPLHAAKNPTSSHRLIHTNNTATTTNEAKQLPSRGGSSRVGSVADEPPCSPSFPDANVGKGTLIWRSSPSSELQQKRLLSHPMVVGGGGARFSSASTQGEDDDDDDNVAASSLARAATAGCSADSSTTTRLLPTTTTAPHGSGYGATTASAAAHPPPPPPPPNDYYRSTNRHTTTNNNNPAVYHDPYVAQHVQDALRRHDEQERERRRWSVCRWACACFIHPLWRCWNTMGSATSMHRSFCYGAIDGMLTGSGIVSTFCGMHLLSTTTNNAPPIRALVVAFTAATCCADAVCMALGHMWATRVLVQAQATERTLALQQLHQSKADAKGLLVDLLLSKGMLKIDAMSLADTLEGYPDLFVNVLTGESLSGGSSAVPSSSTTGHVSGAAGRPSSQQQQQQNMHYPTMRESEIMSASERDDLLVYASTAEGESPGAHVGVDADRHDASQQSHQQHTSQQAMPWRSFHSYFRLNESEVDPDVYIMQSAESESRKESLSMMLGFSLFAVVPSLIYTWVPAILLGSHDAGGVHVSNSSGHGNVAAFANPNTLIISFTAVIMWCLGVWKSRFMDSNWLLFGIETVIVLLVCISVAYGLGALLNKIFLPDDYLLEVVKHSPVLEARISHTSTVDDDDMKVSTTASSTHGQYPHHHFYLF